MNERATRRNLESEDAIAASGYSRNNEAVMREDIEHRMNQSLRARMNNMAWFVGDDLRLLVDPAKVRRRDVA